MKQQRIFDPDVQSLVNEVELGDSTRTTKGSKSDPYDFDLSQWREYENILTDSLWLLGKRDSSGVHTGSYHGNFVPQIAQQAILRFSRPGDVVVDAFVGSGTTLIECQRMGRIGIGIELNPAIAGEAQERVERERRVGDSPQHLIIGDTCLVATWERVRALAHEHGKSGTPLVILHPPYHNIIRFSDLPGDLSGLSTVEDFLGLFSTSVANAAACISNGGHLVLVIGDIYTNSEWVPLGFKCMQSVLDWAGDKKSKFILKGICVKDIQDNRAKRNQEKLWRYRALAGGYYIFKHEYIMFFRKGRR